MKQLKDEANNRFVELRRGISGLQLEEFARSLDILEALIALVPEETRGEFVKLLETLSKETPSPERRGLDRRRALEIVEEVCRQEHPTKNGETQHESDRRVGERRQRDRRKHSRNSGKPWTLEQIETLQSLAERNVPIRRIAKKLGRTSTAILAKAKDIDLPLDPINRNGQL